MKTLVSDEEKPTVLNFGSSANPKELNDILGGYAKSSIEFEQPKEETPGTSADVKDSGTEYYVRGPKKGQPKPTKKNKAVSYDMSASEEISGDIIDGAMFLMLIDLLIPFIIAMANNRFSESKIKASDLQLENDQIKKLTPLCDKVVSYLKLRGNPLVMLIIALVGMYGVKFAAIKATSR
jgi:hypothetical protein